MHASMDLIDESIMRIIHMWFGNHKDAPKISVILVILVPKVFLS